LLCLSLHIVPAEAQFARTWVSSQGSDGNDCNRLTPCRTFQRAHDQTLSLGEITVIDPGGYGAVTITKGISIINDGVGEAGTLVSGGLVGITVNAGANDRVSLRGLTVKGIGFGGGNGIRFNSGASLTIENCVVRNLTGDGIQMLGNVPANTMRTLVLTNTLVTDNDASAIYVQPSGSGAVSVVANRVELYNNGAHGLALDGQNMNVAVGSGIAGVATDSVAANNGIAGFVASSPSLHGGVTLTVKRSLAHANQHGFLVDGASATMMITDVISNANRVSNTRKTNDSQMFSFGDNVAFTHDPITATFPKF
jgi:Right handed beta helix region